MRLIARAIDECDWAARRPRGDMAHEIGVRSQLVPVPPLELGPSSWVVAEPPPELCGRGNVFHPFVDRCVLLAQPARPQAIDQNALPIRPRARLVYPLQS
jgi:hypothetical protein